MCAGYLSFKHSNRLSVSTELCPRSTKSPKNTYDVSGGHPPTLSKRFNKSKNWPCISPTIVTGLIIGWTLDSSMSNSPTYWQSCRRSRSETVSPCFRVEIQASTSSPIVLFLLLLLSWCICICSFLFFFLSNNRNQSINTANEICLFFNTVKAQLRTAPLVPYTDIHSVLLVPIVRCWN